MSIDTDATHFSHIGAAPRDEVPSEPLKNTLTRWALGAAWALKPPRTLGVPATLAAVAAHSIGLGLKPGELPDPEKALRHPDGLCGIASELGVPTLMAAYARGLYPFCHIGPMKWWAPKERMTLMIEDFHIEKNLRRKLRSKSFSVTFDTDFIGVMEACGEARPGRPHLTWITPRIMRAYHDLHRAGHAHSVEVRDEHGALAGGAYGLAVGGAFFTESQFTRQRDASKVGFAVFNQHLQNWGFTVNDGKNWTPHLQQLGFKPIPRAEFNARVSEAARREVPVGRWSVDPALDTAGWDPKAKPRS